MPRGRGDVRADTLRRRLVGLAVIGRLCTARQAREAEYRQRAREDQYHSAHVSQSTPCVLPQSTCRRVRRGLLSPAAVTSSARTTPDEYPADITNAPPSPPPPPPSPVAVEPLNTVGIGNPPAAPAAPASPARAASWSCVARRRAAVGSARWASATAEDVVDALGSAACAGGSGTGLSGKGSTWEWA